MWNESTKVARQKVMFASFSSNDTVHETTRIHRESKCHRYFARPVEMKHANQGRNNRLLQLVSFILSINNFQESTRIIDCHTWKSIYRLLLGSSASEQLDRRRVFSSSHSKPAEPLFCSGNDEV